MRSRNTQQIPFTLDRIRGMSNWMAMCSSADRLAHHEIIQHGVEPMGKQYDEEKPLYIAADLPGVQVKAGQPSEFDQGGEDEENAEPGKDQKRQDVGGDHVPFEHKNAQKGQGVGAHVANGVDAGPQLGFELEAPGNEPVQHIGDQADDQEDCEQQFAATDNKQQDQRKDDDPVQG